MGKYLIGLVLLLSAFSAAQVSFTKSEDPSLTEPKLPVVDYKACPGPSPRVDGMIEPFPVTIKRSEKLYSTWRPNRTVVDTLKPRENVNVWSGVNIISEPYEAKILQPSFPSEIPVLKPGDEILGYGLRGDGNYVFWAKGAWFTTYYEAEGSMAGGCGFSDKTLCTFAFVKKGVQEWWVEVKTKNDVTGWVLAGKNVHEKSWSSPNFGDLCRSD
jgi:hypothetical protein